MSKKSSLPFIETLWRLVNDAETNDVISWAEGNTNTFHIKDLPKLKAETLRKFYASKWESFRRQLYFYGFKSSKKDEFWSHSQLDSTDKQKTIQIKRVKKRKLLRFDDIYPALRDFYPKMFVTNASVLPPMLNPSLANMMRSSASPEASGMMNLAPNMFSPPVMPGFESSEQTFGPMCDFPPAKRAKKDRKE